MEDLINVFDIVFILILLLTPFILKKVLNKQGDISKLTFFLIQISIGFVLVLIFNYYHEYSKVVLLKYYGYNHPCLGVDGDCYKSVVDIERVKELIRSINGIGWPLKAMFQMFFFYVPYILILNLLFFLFKKIKKSLAPNHGKE